MSEHTPHQQTEGAITQMDMQQSLLDHFRVNVNPDVPESED